MPFLGIGPMRLPVPPGEEQPENVRLDFKKLGKQIALMFVKTPREIRMPRADVDGTLFFKSTIGAGLTEITPVKVVKAVATPSTAVALVAASTFCTRFDLQAKKVAADNAGSVFVGLSDLDQGVAELFELKPGESMSREYTAGRKFDLANLYIDADSAGDGVVGWYDPV